MFNLNHFVLLVLPCLAKVFCYTRPETQCNRNDLTCYINVVQEMFKAAVSGNAEQGLEPLDPLLQELVEGKVQNLEYTLRNFTAFGLKNMIVNEVSVPASNHLRIDFFIPFFEMKGDYEIEGKIINYAIEGKGKAFVNATNVHYIVDTEEEFYEKGGTKHLKLKITKVETKILGKLHLNLENLFNGNKELADPVLKFINENYKIVADIMQDARPISSAFMNKLVKNANVILAEIPVEYFLNMN